MKARVSARVSRGGVSLSGQRARSRSGNKRKPAVMPALLSVSETTEVTRLTKVSAPDCPTTKRVATALSEIHDESVVNRSPLRKVDVAAYRVLLALDQLLSSRLPPNIMFALAVLLLSELSSQNQADDVILMLART